MEREEQLLSEGRDGDHLMGIPFQFKLCHMTNMEGQNLIPSAEGLLVFTRRENLDSF